VIHHVVVIGGGIVGLAVAREAGLRWPGASVTVLEKEASVATHQTGHNSGVVHSGLYYPPDSLKARLCTHGVKLLRTYCAEKGIEIRDVGKVVIAVRQAEEQRLEALYQRGVANGVPDLRMISACELRRLEPHAAARRAIHSPHTAIVDYGEVSRALADDVAHHGQVVLGAEVVGVRRRGHGGIEVEVGGVEPTTYPCDLLINCAGLQSDRVATLTGDPEEPRIVPFRGEYYSLRPAARGLVNGLIYPVPDPRYPFLGVHLTPTMTGDVLVGPNAVLAYSREGYTRTRIRVRDVRDTLAWPGFWSMARRHWRTGALEMYRSLSKHRYARSARDYVPELTADDLAPAPAGVRAQAVARDGSLVDDFWISEGLGVLNVRNAPSPAATAALAIAEYVCGQAGHR
jgi:L-2-hydroxyglutarate oxidase LhgO